MPIDQAVMDEFVDDCPTEASRIAARTVIELARKVVPERFSSLPVEAGPHAPLIAAYLDHLEARPVAWSPRPARGSLSLRAGFSPGTTRMSQDSRLRR